MAELSIQEKYINELFDPRSALSPREVAAREEIATLRAKLEKNPPAKKPAKVKELKQDG